HLCTGGHPAPGRDRRCRLGERLPLTEHVGAQPLTLPPLDARPVRSDLDIPRPGGDPAPRPRRPRPALRTPTDPLVGSADTDHAHTVAVEPHRVDDHSFETE